LPIIAPYRYELRALAYRGGLPPYVRKRMEGALLGL